MGTQASSRVYTISELNSEVQSYLKQRYPVTLWVQGEIKNYNRNAHKDHIFFELCEKDPDSVKIRARVTAVIFEGNKARIGASLAKIEAGFRIQDDIEVTFECLVDLYPPSGSYQLKVVDIDPVYTLGKIAQQRHLILETLKKEGLLEKNKQLSAPLVPLRIGLLTSYNSAAYHDFLKELAESQYGFRVFHADSHMQGHLVEQEVCQGIRLLHEYGVDVIVIIRGGGSRSDMAWFDSFKIGRAVAHSTIPIFTGLGHEIDLSVTDLVAHTHQKTPTAVAQQLVELVREYVRELERIGGEILQLGEELVQRADQQVMDSIRKIEESATHRIQQSRQLLVDCSWEVRESHHRLIRDTLLYLRSGSERIKIRSGFNIRTAWEGLAMFKQRLPKLTETRLKTQSHRLEMFGLRRDALDPIRVLKRGYTLSLSRQGKTIRRVSEVKIGDFLTTVFADGQLKSQVAEKSSLHKPSQPQPKRASEQQMTFL